MISMPVNSWSEFKTLVDDKKLFPQYKELSGSWEIFAVESFFVWSIGIPKGTSDETDFINNNKSKYNKPISNISSNVNLKMAKASATTDSNGDGTLLIKIPSDRVIDGAIAWFDNPTDGDYAKVYLTDEDNLLGQGAGYQVGSFTDEDTDASEQGWFFPNNRTLEVTHLVNPEYLTSGYYLKIIVKKGNSTVDTLRVNLKWG